MAFDNTAYRLIYAGQSTASADTAHLLVNGGVSTYNGLSDLGTTDLLFVGLMASNNDALLFAGSDNASGTAYGHYLSSSAIGYDYLPGTQRQKVDVLHFKNKTASNNTSVNYSIWRKI